MTSIHCITLTSEPGRLQHVESQKAAWGEPGFHIVDAIDGRKQFVPPHDGGETAWSHELVRERAARLGMKEIMNEPGKACTKGHVLLAQQRLDDIRAGKVSEDDYYLVLEDDFAWHDVAKLKAFVGQIQRAPSPRFDVIYLGYRGGEQRHIKAPVHRALHTLKSRLASDPVDAAVAWLEAQRWPGRARGPLGLRAAGQHLGTHGYLMNGRGAAAIVEVGSSLSLPADHTFKLAQAFGLARFAIAPEKLVVTLVELGSTIRSEQEFKRAAQRIPTT